MTTPKALLYSLVITIVSILLLMISRGVPTTELAVKNSFEMFLVAFVVLRFFAKGKS